MAFAGADACTIFSQDRQDVEHLVAVLTQRAQDAATIRAIAVACLRFDPLLGAWKMARQGANRHWPLGLGRWRILAGIGDSGFAFELLECQFELFDLGRQLLRRLTERHAAQLRQLETQCVDQRVTGRQGCFQLGDLGIFIKAGSGCIRHRDPLAKWVIPYQKNQANR